MAANGPPPGKGPGGGTETAGNNLSVPAIFVPSSTASGAPALRVACDQTPQAPTGPQSPEYPDYWLQQTDATWSAYCTSAAAATATADWGDNLTTAPTVRTGKPIRVEVGLLDSTDSAALGKTGYVVDNLTPTVEDRNATYGTDGTTFTTGDPGAPVTRVWDSGAHLTIVNDTTGTTVIDQAMTAEINSTGAVVYGFNWGSKGRVNAPAPGTYTLTFTTSDATTINGIADTAGLNVPSWTAHSTSLTVTLTSRAGGGGGGHSGSHGNH